MNNLSPKVWSKDFILIFISNFLVFLCYYMLVPILQLYFRDSLGYGESMAGIIVASFTIASLTIRPISGFIVDKFARKPLYLLCYALFTFAMGGYALASSLTLIIMLRVMHGYGFGLNTVGGLTYAIDVLPSERRGEGIGYFGVAYSVAMAVGPLFGIMLRDLAAESPTFTFDHIFLIAFALGLLGMVLILFIKPVPKIEKGEGAAPQKLSLGRFILLRGLPCVLIIVFSGYGYGAVSNFVAGYAKDVAWEGANAGYFFFVLASGIVVARILSAKMINRGEVLKATYVGGGLVVASYILFLICSNAYIFYSLALLFGLGFGYFGSSFQTMLVNMAEPTQRGTASATYYTFWDMGIGLGIATGGFMLDAFDFQALLILCVALVVVSLIYFRFVSDRYYTANKLS